MRAHDLVGQVPTVELDLPVVEAARLLAEECLPGLIVVDDHGRPVALLPDVEVLRLLVPAYVQDSPAVARVIDEGHADVLLTDIGDRTVGQCLTDQRLELPVVSADATLVEIATLMARTRCRLAAVVDQSMSFLGIVTQRSLLKGMFAP